MNYFHRQPSTPFVFLLVDTFPFLSSLTRVVGKVMPAMSTGSVASKSEFRSAKSLRGEIEKGGINGGRRAKEKGRMGGMNHKE